MRASRTVSVIAASAATALVFAGAVHAVVQDHSSPMAAPTPTATRSAALMERPLSNSCSAGHVTFTFDDGPRENTERVLDALDALDVDAVFFWNGGAVRGRESTVSRALAEGHVLGNHTFDHPNLVTGELPDGSEAVWTPEWVRSELERTNEALTDAGAPRPDLYRPPYGAVDDRTDEVAQELGLRLVMPWGNDGDNNYVDSRDTEGATTQEIIDRTVGSMRDGSIITMHDGQRQATLNSIGALQAIVDAMNEKNLCATTDVREDAAGRGLDTYG